MSRANIQPQQAERGSASPERGKGQAVNIQIEIGRAFEVASAIEKAIRVESAEGLEQFLTRVIGNMLVRSEGTYLAIERTDGVRYPQCIVVYDHAPSRFPPNASFTLNLDCSSYSSGHPISVTVFFESEQQGAAATQILQKFGFELDHGYVEKAKESKWRDRNELDCRFLVGFLCSVLQGLWDITDKNSVRCGFVHDMGKGKRSQRRLVAEIDLRQCLVELASEDPDALMVDVVDENDESMLDLIRSARGTLGFVAREAMWSALDSKVRLTIQAVMKDANYELDPEYRDNPDWPECGWLGPENPDTAAIAISKLLEMAGTGIKSSTLSAELYWPVYCA